MDGIAGDVRPDGEGVAGSTRASPPAPAGAASPAAPRIAVTPTCAVTPLAPSAPAPGGRSRARRGVAERGTPRGERGRRVRAGRGVGSRAKKVSTVGRWVGATVGGREGEYGRAMGRGNSRGGGGRASTPAGDAHLAVVVGEARTARRGRDPRARGVCRGGALHGRWRGGIPRADCVRDARRQKGGREGM